MENGNIFSFEKDFINILPDRLRLPLKRHQIGNRNY